MKTRTTLFDPNCKGFVDEPTSHDYPFSVIIQGLDAESGRFHEDEVSVFQQVAEHEFSLYEPRGLIAGDLQLMVNGDTIVQLDGNGAPFRLPNWVESDGLSFERCRASGILLVERDAVFRALCKAQAWKQLGLLLVSGCGVPRLEVRRFLHRLSSECEIPVYFLSDNDTWGYFIFSLMKRGALAPCITFKYAGINDLRYLGVRAFDADQFNVPRSLRRPWEPHWSLRMEYLKQYPCFASAGWQVELGHFQSGQLACDLHTLVETVGLRSFVSDYLLHRLNNAGWLL